MAQATAPVIDFRWGPSRDWGDKDRSDMTGPGGRASPRPCGSAAALHGLRRELLCLGQRQPQTCNVTKLVGPTDLHHVDPLCPVVEARFDQLQNPPHPRSLSRQHPDQSYRFCPHPPNLWTVPWRDLDALRSLAAAAET